MKNNMIVLFTILLTHLIRPAYSLDCSSTPGKYTKECNVVCPPQTKKFGTIGSRADLPAGYMIIKNSTRGLDIVNVREGTPVLIPNTGDAIEGFQNPDWVRISTNGKWILFRTTQGLTLIKIDGSGKTVVKQNNSAVTGMCQWDFVRLNPKGYDEIWWWKSGTITAMKVDLEGATPQFGPTRTLASGGFNFECGDYRRALFVSGNHAYGAGASSTHPTWMDLTSGNTWRYTNFSQNSACGHAMSWDGTLVCENPAPPNNTSYSCIPANGLHVGPVIMPFFEPSTPSMQQLDVWMKSSESLNFCPEALYKSEVHDFHMWNWSNDRNYLSCRQVTGVNNVWLTGVWILHWPTNVWTNVVELTKNGSNQSAVYFSNIVPVTVSKSAYRTVPLQSNEIKGSYDIRGRTISEKNCVSGKIQRVRITKLPSGKIEYGVK